MALLPAGWSCEPDIATWLSAGATRCQLLSEKLGQQKEGRERHAEAHLGDQEGDIPTPLLLDHLLGHHS